MPGILRSITRFINLSLLDLEQSRLKAAERLEAIRVEWMEDTDYEHINLAAYASELSKWDRTGEPPEKINRYHPGKDRFLRCRTTASIGNSLSSRYTYCLNLCHRSVPFTSDERLLTLVEYRLLAELKEHIERDARVATTGFWEIANEHGRYDLFVKRALSLSGRPGLGDAPSNLMRSASFRLDTGKEVLHKTVFAANTVAAVMAMPNHKGADIDLRVYDSTGDLVGNDTNLFACPLVLWTSSSDPVCELVVRNTGEQATSFTLFAN